jgi:hypothetical protein
MQGLLPYHKIKESCLLVPIAMFGFLLSFLTNPWIDASGYSLAFGEMASTSGGVLLLFIPFYFYGREIRNSSVDWAILRKIG